MHVYLNGWAHRAEVTKMSQKQKRLGIEKQFSPKLLYNRILIYIMHSCCRSAFDLLPSPDSHSEAKFIVSCFFHSSRRDDK